jgi:hypothetical protein
VPHEQRNVFHAFPEGRQANRENVEPVEQILAKCALDDPSFKIPVCRRDDPDVHGNPHRAPKPLDSTLFQHAEQLDLDVGRQVADLVEEDRRAIRQLETSVKAPFSRPNNSLSMSVAGIAAQFTRTISRLRRALRR